MFVEVEAVKQRDFGFGRIWVSILVLFLLCMIWGKSRHCSEQSSSNNAEVSLWKLNNSFRQASLTSVDCG